MSFEEEIMFLEILIRVLSVLHSLVLWFLSSHLYLFLFCLQKATEKLLENFYHLIIIFLVSLRTSFWVWVGFPGGSEVKAFACNAGDLGLIPGSGRSSGEGNGNPLQYSCLENAMDGGAWWTVVHRSQRVGHDWATSLSLSLIKFCPFCNVEVVLPTPWNSLGGL